MEKMPIEWKGWTLVKEYKYFGLYTNGKYNQYFDRFDVGIVERRRKQNEVRLFNESVGKCTQY